MLGMVFFNTMCVKCIQGNSTRYRTQTAGRPLRFSPNFCTLVCLLKKLTFTNFQLIWTKIASATRNSIFRHFFNFFTFSSFYGQEKEKKYLKNIPKQVFDVKFPAEHDTAVRKIRKIRGKPKKRRNFSENWLFFTFSGLFEIFANLCLPEHQNNPKNCSSSHF